MLFFQPFLTCAKCHDAETGTQLGPDIAKAGKSAGPMQSAWEQALSAMKLQGSSTGARAEETVTGLVEQARTAMRESRASSAKAAEVMLQGYATLVSGVLIGMSEGMQAGGAAASASPSRAAAPAPAPAAKAAAKKRRR